MKKQLKVLFASTLLFLFSMGLYAQSGLSNAGAVYFDGSGKPPLEEVCTTSTVWVWMYVGTISIPVPYSVKTCTYQYDTSQ